MTPNGQRWDFGGKFPAALIDLCIITIPTAIALAVLHERFAILPGDGDVRFSLSDQQRIDEMDRGLSRAVEFGDSLYTLSGSGWWLTLTLFVMLTILVYVAVPSRCRNRTPGRLLMSVAPVSTPEPELVATIDLSDEKQSSSTAEPATEKTKTEAADLEESTAEHPAGNLSVDVDIAVDIDVDTRTEDDTEAAVTVEETIEADQVDVTDTSLFGPITLADEAEYLSWERNLSFPTDLRDRPNTATISTYDQLALPESSLSDAPLTAATLVKTAAGEQRSHRDTQPASAPPVWNEAWNAWLYWDSERHRWFRHDTKTGRWKALQ